MPDPIPGFRIHPETEVFSTAGDNEVSCEFADDDAGTLLFVPGKHLPSALRMIAAAVGRSQEFCVTSDRVSENTRTAPSAEPHFQCMSSGTTGRPRRIRRSQTSWLRSFRVNAELFGISPDDSYGITGSLAHSLSLYGTLEAAYLGADIHALANLRPDKQYDLMSDQRTSVIYSTPTLLRQICRNSQRRAPLEDVRLVFCGGGRLTRPDVAAFEKLLPNATIREFYGASETSFITITDDSTPAGSVGRPYPGVEIQIRDENGNRTTGSGELWVKSPYLFSGYAEGTATGTRCCDGFLTIGELGWLDHQGFLYLAGRKSRMVTIADENVFPEEAEVVLMEEPGIGQCTVVSRDDPIRGNILVAVTDTDPGNAKPEILKRARKLLGALKAPRDLIYLRDYPLLPGGKPDISEIERRIRSQN